MGAHLHKRLSVQEVKEVIERYLSREIGVDHVLALLKIHRRRFFDLLKRYRKAPDLFSPGLQETRLGQSSYSERGDQDYE